MKSVIGMVGDQQPADTKMRTVQFSPGLLGGRRIPPELYAGNPDSKWGGR